MSITREIREYALQNPLASEVDIRDKFGVTRQLVSRLFNNIFTRDELEVRRLARLNIQIDDVRDMLKRGCTFTEIYATLKMPKTHLTKMLEENADLREILQAKADSENARISAISDAWVAGQDIQVINQTFNIAKTTKGAISVISKYRLKYGEILFPIRRDNRFDIHEKIRRYEALKLEGFKDIEICAKLGYLNVTSMKSSFNNKKAHDVT